MKKCVIVLILCLCLAGLSACGGNPQNAAESPVKTAAEPTPVPAAEPTPAPVTLNGQTFPRDAESITLSDAVSDPASLREGLSQFTALRSLTFERTVPETELAAWADAWKAFYADFPSVAFTASDVYRNAGTDTVAEFAPAALSDAPEAELLAIREIFPNLNRLDLSSLSVSRETVAFAAGLEPGFTVLWNDAVFGPSDSSAAALTFSAPTTLKEAESYLSCFPHLAEADLLESGLTEAEGDSLFEAFPNVALRRMVTLIDEPLDSFTEELDLRRAQIKDFDAFGDALSKFPRLKNTELHFCSLTNEQLAALRDRYPEKHIVWTVCFNKWKVRTDVVAFSTLQLAPNDNRVPSKDAQVLQYCTDLVALDLGHNGITDLEWLRPLKKLQVLILADNAKLSDITPIGSLTKLKYIELFMTSVEDITPLSNLPDLLDANLCFTKITDVTPLKRCTKLERIWFGRQVAGQIGEAGIADLQSALPNAVIDTDVRSSTYNGWRDHPRYSAYIRMFRYNITVEPFVPED